MHKIAVITPSFNSADFIADCITSVRCANTFGICEITHIIVDDASTDNTWTIINSFKSEKLKVFKLTENKGPAFARNYAIEQCAADFIFCLDADDVLFQNSLYVLLVFALETKADWVYGDMLRGDTQLRYLLTNDYYGWNFKTPIEVLKALFSNNHFFQQNCLLSKQAFMQAGEYDPSLHMAEDFDLYVRMLLLNYHPHYLPGPLYMHRFHNNNLSQLYTKHPEKNLEIIAKIHAKYADQLQALGI